MICQGCNGYGMVGNILHSETCPFCQGTGGNTVSRNKREGWYAGRRISKQWDYHFDDSYGWVPRKIVRLGKKHFRSKSPSDRLPNFIPF